MNIGELVRHKVSRKVGVVLRVFTHKLWRTEDRGIKVDFGAIKPEPFAEVQFGGDLMKIPQVDLEYV